MISTSLQYLTSPETLKSGELCVNRMPKTSRHRSLLSELRDTTLLVVAVLGSAISACDKIMGGERGCTFFGRFFSFCKCGCNEADRAAAHIKSLTFRVKKRFLVPNL